MNNQFVQFECYCKGILLGDQVLVLEECEDNEPEFRLRPVGDFREIEKSMTEEERDNIISNIKGLIVDGKKYRELKKLLS